jgi:hypothetical protein
MPLSMIVCLPPVVPAASIHHPEQGSVNHPRRVIFWTTLAADFVALAEIDGVAGDPARDPWRTLGPPRTPGMGPAEPVALGGSAGAGAALQHAQK